MGDVDREGIVRELSAYLRELVGGQAPITDESVLADLGVDSLGLVKLFVFIERQFGLPLINAGLTRRELATFGSLCTAVTERLEAGVNGTTISQRNCSNRHDAELGLGVPRGLS
jgi:acyl carrier protein